MLDAEQIDAFRAMEAAQAAADAAEGTQRAASAAVPVATAAVPPVARRPSVRTPRP